MTPNSREHGHDGRRICNPHSGSFKVRPRYVRVAGPAIFSLLLATCLLPSDPGFAHEITAGRSAAVPPAFDIVAANVIAGSHGLEFKMRVSGSAGSSKPAASGKLAGSSVFSYVWPTALDSGAVGFDPGEGILALAVTAHPDFDDTPLFDENGDGNLANDGDVWHAHWVVLDKDADCPGGLKVKDIAPGTTPKLPLTWPGLPLLIDSPGYSPIIAGETVSVRVPMAGAPGLAGTAFDGVTSGLRVNESAHAPLLCVADVFKIASGDLSLPGRVSE